MPDLTAPRPGASLPTDLLLALGVAVLGVLGSMVGVRDDIWATPIGPAGPLLPSSTQLFLLLGASLPLTFRRVAPVPVLIMCVAASLGLQALRRPELLPLGVLVALYTVAVCCRPLVCSIAATLYLATLLVGTATGRAPLSDDYVFNYLIVIGGSLTLGYGVALGRARARLAEQRIAEIAREQDERTRAAVKEEQSRIAREVHDIVAHDVSVMVAQSSAARRVLTSRPDTVEQALSSIESVGRDALDGLRGLLGLLRTDGSAADRNPQPGLDRLPWLLSQVRRAGLPVEFTVRGHARPLPAMVELNAYRIVQEALTNSLKHAGPTHAAVVLDYGEDALDIEVSDPGRSDRPRPAMLKAGVTGPPTGDPGDTQSDPAGSRGFGLIGMQQRVAMLGGELTAGSEDASGFRVAVRLPVAGLAP